MHQECTMISRHVQLHTFQEGFMLLSNHLRTMVRDVLFMKVGVDSQEDVEGMDERALACAGTRKFFRHQQSWILFYAFKYPFPSRLRIFSPKPRPDLMEEYLGITSVLDLKQQLS